MAVTEGQLISDGTAIWKVRRIGVTGIPVGFTADWPADTIPDGWLLCDGSAISRTDYADLFAVIGTKWGEGDGSTTFNLPNSIGRFAEGASEAGSYHEAGLPNITGMHGIETVYADGAFWFDKAISKPGSVSSSASVNDFMIHFDASRCSSIYGNSTTVQPPSYTVRKIIKY